MRRKRMGKQTCMYFDEGKFVKAGTQGKYQPAIYAGWLEMCDSIIREKLCQGRNVAELFMGVR
jgi:hypothetical protein